MKLGLSTYALTWSFGIAEYKTATKLSLSEFLDIAAKLGHEGAQIVDSAPLLELTADERQTLWQKASDRALDRTPGIR